MEKITNVFYVDAGFGFEEEIPETLFLTEGEAYGYVFSNQNDFFVHFIKKVDEKISPHKFFKGLIIPKSALISRAQVFKSKNDFKKGEKVDLVWEDVVLVAHNERKRSSIMKTSGTVFADIGNQVLLERALTMRTYPLPEINHPEDDIPSYFVIPKTMITKTDKILKSSKDKKPTQEKEDDEDINRVVQVHFWAEDKNKYECVGVLMNEEGDFIEIAFNAINGEVKDFLKIPKKFVKEIREIDKSEVEILR